MFDFNEIINFAKVEQGHGLLQCVLLFMIWWQSRGLRKDLTNYKEQNDKMFEKLDLRVKILEGVKAI